MKKNQGFFVMSGKIRFALVLCATVLLMLTSCAGARSRLAVPSETVDVVVIGGGGAGITAASHLLSEGKSVILVEKLGIMFGNTALASTQMWAAESSMQRALGLTETSDDFYNFLIRTGRNRGLNMDSAATRVMAQRSGEMMDWLLGIGVPFGRVFNIWSHGPADGSMPGAAFMIGLQAELDRSGLDYRLNTRATELIMNNGKIAGVKVTGPNGEYIINARAVIICSGGFANNPEMIAKYDPRWATLGTSGAIGQTGDGIRMAQAVGAEVVDMDMMTINPTVLFRGEQGISLTPLRANGAIMVNKLGKRFTNEMGGATIQTLAMLEQEGQTAFMIFDDTMIRTIELMRQYKELGFFQQANSIEELARIMGIDPEGLTSTVNTYRTFVRNNHDPEFGRTFMAIDFENPPFYAVRVEPAVQSTAGGIKVDIMSRVIDTNSNIIPGLFAAGSVAGEGTKAVSPLTKTFVFARIAGEAAVEYLR